MNEFLQILGVYSVKDVIAIAAVVIATSLIKIPIKRAASKYAQNGGNKSLINSLIVFLCVVLSFCAALVVKLMELNWDWSALPWADKASDVLPQWAIIFIGASTIYAILWQAIEKGIGAAFQAVVKAIQKKGNGEVVDIIIESDAAVAAPVPALEPEPEQKPEPIVKKKKEEPKPVVKDPNIKYL